MAALRSGRRVRLLLSAAVVAVSTLAAAGPVQASARADSGGSQDLAQYVNPFVGTKPGGPDFGTGGGAGNTFPGADVPFGMVQWSPDTNRDQPGGYYYDDNQIRGFSVSRTLCVPVVSRFFGRGVAVCGCRPVVRTSG
jgi:putative alpha-1,2-mannosidase